MKRSDDYTWDSRKSYADPPSSVRDAMIWILWEIQKGICYLCGLRMQEYGRRSKLSAQIAHIVPKCSDGNWDISNLRLAHRRCNAAQGTKTPYEFWSREIERLKKMSRRITDDPIHVPCCPKASAEAIERYKLQRIKFGIRRARLLPLEDRIELAKELEREGFPKPHRYVYPYLPYV